MKFRLIFLMAVFFIIFAKEAMCEDINSARSLFHNGNAHYSEGNFQQAVVDYQKALSLGFESGALYYNLGNAYFKQGSLGRAILNYSRAQRLLPNDADLKSNLNYAQSLVKGAAAEPKEAWLLRNILNLADSFNLDEITLISAVLYSTLSILIILFLILKSFKKFVFYASLPVAALTVVSLAFFTVCYYNVFINKQAVVVSKSTDCKFEPFDSATTFFSLNEGERVVLIRGEDEKGWIKIRRADGKQAWIKKIDIEALS